MLELVPLRQEEDQVNVTPDSSVTGNSKLDLDSSLILFQVMSDRINLVLFVLYSVYRRVILHTFFVPM